MPTQPIVDKAGFDSDIHHHSRLIVSFKLRERDAFILNLKSQKDISNIPLAKTYFES